MQEREEELYQKEQEAIQQIENKNVSPRVPTVEVLREMAADAVGIIDENPTIYLKKNVGGFPRRTASRLRMSRWISCWIPFTACCRMCL